MACLSALCIDASSFCWMADGANCRQEKKFPPFSEIKYVKIALHECLALKTIEKVIINSYEQSLYLVSIIINDEERFVTDKKGNFIKSFNKLELQKLFSNIPVEKVVVRHKSAYSEMIGLKGQEEDNTMEVLIGGDEYANP